jgi:PhnB protein
MKTNTYVNFHGNCTEALQYYEKHLGAKVGMMMTHAQSPGQIRVHPEWKDAVLHARISLGDAEVWAAEIPNAEPMRSAYLTLRMDSDGGAERVFSALSDGGQVLRSKPSYRQTIAVRKWLGGLLAASGFSNSAPAVGGNGLPLLPTQ